MSALHNYGVLRTEVSGIPAWCVCARARTRVYRFISLVVLT